VVLAKGCEEVVAYLLASSTHLCAEAAVFVVGSVKLALLGTGQAGHCTGFDARADDTQVGSRLPCQEAAGGLANIGAVEVEAYAPNQVCTIVLAETVIGARGATSDAVEALLNAAQDQIAIQGCRARMQLEYLWKDHVLHSRFELDGRVASHAGGIEVGLRCRRRDSIRGVGTPNMPPGYGAPGRSQPVITRRLDRGSAGPASS
jgi:hypothetical protein